MKIAAPAIATAAVLALAACADGRPTHTDAEARESHQRAAGQADRSFNKENPADPSALK